MGIFSSNQLNPLFHATVVSIQFCRSLILISLFLFALQREDSAILDSKVVNTFADYLVGVLFMLSLLPHGRREMNKAAIEGMLISE